MGSGCGGAAAVKYGDGWLKITRQVVVDKGVRGVEQIQGRELGIIAVGGCGDATMGVHTGDWVKVDDGTGMVEALRRAWGSSV